MKHLIDPTDLTKEEIDSIIELGHSIMENPEKYHDIRKYNKLATLFYEPSTRTRLSFTAAMMDLGGNVLGFADASNSSVSKGETVADTTRVVENFADIIAMRHYWEGAPLVAALSGHIPVINAGDGAHSHPTQTLTDLLTIRCELGDINGLTIGLCGDLKFGRTVHSLLKALTRYDNITAILISPQELRLPEYIREDVSEHITIREARSIEEVISELDVLYMTRVQRERFSDLEEYEAVKNSFILTASMLKDAKQKMAILHPLPRVNEIATDVDDDPRAAYFRQTKCGKFVRMALIHSLLQWRNEPDINHGFKKVEGYCCPNPKCISNHEKVEPLYKDIAGTLRCAYCDCKPVKKD